MLLGNRWVSQNLNADIKTGWLIDTFGLHAQVPQVLNQFGIKYLFANRLGGDKYYDMFTARGIDGSKVLIAGRDIFSPFVKQDNIFFMYYTRWEKIDNLFDEAAKAEGIGPYAVIPYTENEGITSAYPIILVEKANNETHEADWCFSLPASYFDAVQKSDKEFPILDGDLNPEFTGKFSLRMPLRLRNRKLENMLLEAEKWTVLKQINSYEDEIEQAWWNMSFIHSHDIITGFHTTKVYNTSMGKLDDIENTAKKVLDAAITQTDSNKENKSDLSKAHNSRWIKVYNGLPFEREGVIEIQKDECNIEKIVYRDLEIPFSYNGAKLHILADLPPCGYKTFKIITGNSTVKKINKNLQANIIENEYILLECDQQSGIKRLVWKPTQSILIENADDFLTIQRDMGNFRYEDIQEAPVPASAGTIKIDYQEETPVSSRIKLSGEFPKLHWMDNDGFLKWNVEFSLIKGKPLLSLRVKICWHGEQSRIRLNIPTCIDSAEGIYEIPFGVVKRKPYGLRRTSKGEWPLHRFVAIEDEKLGIALINTGVIGAQIEGGTIQTTLMRAPWSNQGDWEIVRDKYTSQHGELEFNFAIAPYVGTWEDTRIAQLAQEVNNPAYTTIIHQKENEFEEVSLLRIDADNLVLSTVKAAQDKSDEIIVRLYETVGKRVNSNIFFKNTKQAWLSNVKEERLDELECHNDMIKVLVNPFEIITLRIKSIKNELY